MKLENLYNVRFSREENRKREELWKILCKDFLQRYIMPGDTVIELGAGNCEFLRNISCGRKIGVERERERIRDVGPDIKQIIADARSVKEIGDGEADVVFVCNLLEHLEDKEHVVDVIKESYRMLKASGKLIVLQPNIRYAFREYWDFFDHIVPLSDRSIVELLLSLGFFIVEVRSRFLPYTTKSRISRFGFLLRILLRSRLLQMVFGKQMFVVAVKR